MKMKMVQRMIRHRIFLRKLEKGMKMKKKRPSLRCNSSTSISQRMYQIKNRRKKLMKRGAPLIMLRVIILRSFFIPTCEIQSLNLIKMKDVIP